jgi:transposase
MEWICAALNCVRGTSGKRESSRENIFKKSLNVLRDRGSDHATNDCARSELSQQLAECQQALAAALRENQRLRQKIDLLVRRVFGSSSEKLDAAQLQLLQLSEAPPVAEPLPAPPSQTPPAPRPRPPKAPRLPDNLPVVEEVIDPEPVKAQPENWRQIGQEVTEQLDYEPGRFLKRRTVRRTYVHRTNQDSAPVTAPLPPCLQERGLAAPGLLAHVLVSKYCDHLPLYRQEQIYAQRHGLNLPRQTLARWVELAANWLTPIYEQIRAGVLAGRYVQIDETPITQPK